MKKKIIIVLIVVLLMVGVFFFGRQVGLNTQQNNTQIITTQKKVSTQSIKKTLTSSGTVASKKTEKVELSTSKYFEAMCVEVDDTVSKGDKILKYTDGTYLKASKDCVIISTNLPETETKATSSNYVEVSYLNKLTISLSISENELSSVKVGQKVEISLTADDSKTYTGKITKIDSVGTYSNSGTTFDATVEFENDGNVKLGMSVSCTIIIKEEKDAICVPINAVATNSNGEKYVVKVNSDGTTEEVVVETGISDENYVQITSGLTTEDTVQIETEITQDANTSSSQNSNNMFGGRGGQMPGGSGNMPSGGFGERPSGDSNKRGSSQNSTKGSQNSSKQ